MTDTSDHDKDYRKSQSQIYGLQDTIPNSTGSSRWKKEKIQDRGRISAGDATRMTVNSKSVLEYAYSNFGEPKAVVGSFQYHAFKEARRETESMPFPFDLYELSAPRPFLPGYGLDMINHLIEVKISYEDLQASIQLKDSPRTMNNEIWGTDIHTDDSDPILVLRHCGLSPNDVNGTCRTPANLHNPDNIVGTVPPTGTPFEVEVQLLLLPPLQKYSASRRYGISSRQWGDGVSVPHDGLSYGVYSIKILPRDKSTENVKEKDQKVNIADWS